MHPISDQPVNTRHVSTRSRGPPPLDLSGAPPKKRLAMMVKREHQELQEEVPTPQYTAPGPTPKTKPKVLRKRSSETTTTTPTPQLIKTGNYLLVALKGYTGKLCDN